MRTLATLAFALLFGASAPAFAGNRDDAERELAAARTALDAAESADAARYAHPELVTARSMLDVAELELDRRDYDDAALDAEKARVDAELATARARQQRAELATAEIEAAVETLRQQLAATGG